MSRYESWSSGSIAKWLRSICGRLPAMRSGTWDEWAEWERREKAAAPILYWVLNTGIRKIQRTVYYPAEMTNNIRWFIRNRFFLRIHSLPTLAKIDHWMDLDDRLLYGCFNALVNFVEIELAEMHYFSCPDWFAENGLSYSRWPWWRSAAAGVAHLELYANMDTDHEDFSERQMNGAKETRALYRWWVEERPARPDPMEASGLGAIYDATLAAGVDFMSERFERSPEYWACSERNSEIEKQYETEDTEMLLRLIKHRGECWT